MTELALDQTTVETFRPHVGEHFESEEGVTFELSEAEPLRTGSEHRQAFSLLFKSPGDVDTFHLDVWLLSHPTLGELTLSLVPIGPDGEGKMQWEAVFT